MCLMYASIQELPNAVRFASEFTLD